MVPTLSRDSVLGMVVGSRQNHRWASVRGLLERKQPFTKARKRALLRERNVATAGELFGDTTSHQQQMDISMEIKLSSDTNSFKFTIGDEQATSQSTFHYIKTAEFGSAVVSLCRQDAHLQTISLKDPKHFWKQVKRFSIPVHATNKDAHLIVGAAA